MVDVSTMIAAKSDQLNADDLMTGPITITVTGVKGTGDKEQPLSISYENDNGKPYKPGKSMRRVLVQLWGKEGAAYVGRSMTLYRDGEVTFGKLKVGGIRISHMTDIGVDQILALAVTKGAKRAYQVKPLRPPEGRSQQQHQQQSRQRMTPEQQVDAYIKSINDPAVVPDLDAMREYQSDERRANWLSNMRDNAPDLHARIVEANSKRVAELLPDDEVETEDGKPTADPAADDGDDDFPGDR